MNALPFIQPWSFKNPPKTWSERPTSGPETFDPPFSAFFYREPMKDVDQAIIITIKTQGITRYDSLG
jgi:hypothetical protein